MSSGLVNCLIKESNQYRIVLNQHKIMFMFLINYFTKTPFGYEPEGPSQNVKNWAQRRGTEEGGVCGPFDVGLRF